MVTALNTSSEANTDNTKNSKEPALEKVTLNNETWFKIPDHQRMRPFFMNIVSDSNHWMFISSNGGLTAGRKNSNYALFPYYTDDKITESADITGSKTIFRLSVEGKLQVWEPFSERFTGKYAITRNLYKNFHGNKIMFEEVNHDLSLSFQYQWNSSNLFGFVRTAELFNLSDKSQTVEVLDGIQNLLPYGVEPDLQNASSNLVDAYKRSELVANTGLGIYALSAIIVDKAEPSEALKANVAWSAGLQPSHYLVSSLQLNTFRSGGSLVQENDVKGEKGAYFMHSEVLLEAHGTKSWKIVANVNQNHAQIQALNKAIDEDSTLLHKIDEDIQNGTETLQQLVAGADGIRKSADTFKDARHFSNVLFNIMRGGTFDHNDRIEKKDFIAYIQSANKEVYSRNQSLFSHLKDSFSSFALYTVIERSQDADLYRLGKEYLPLKFSRRHGDPSRPWNKFSINTRSEVDGSKILDYEGNWRDIFQNWEALVHSYPMFIEGMIFKFLNTSTFDGYNPYRVTKGGFDWETIEPDNPWSYIGYWGDHQIIYMLKFLEFYRMHKPGGFDELMKQSHFVYANVPYRIKAYQDIVLDHKNTIDFDHDADQEIRDSVAALGADGALMRNSESSIHRVGFIEKILASVLAKLSNFIPEAGIWLNTQRPEWNDANNALVGNGVSMVTLFYLRRFLYFFEEILETSEVKDVKISKEMAHFFMQVYKVLNENQKLLKSSVKDSDRKKITDALGQAGSEYRVKIYENGFSGELESLSVSEFHEFVKTARKWMEHSIRANRRPDKLYHAYNIMSMEDEGIRIAYLSEMLEGQVAVLSSGYLSPKESLEVLDALRNSALYREDQNSYILYPNKNLPRFLEKNSIPASDVAAIPLLKKLVKDGNNAIIQKDVYEVYHFNGDFRNAADVKSALAKLAKTTYSELVEKDEKAVLQLFEKVFNHKAFTGRSGTFFAYEGLGSIYWHMVSKLYLAVFEVCELARTTKETDPEIAEQLSRHFYAIADGIGVHKSPMRYGAFPTDAYSHTPAHRGAQQPGMTGQVKEDILAGFGELGVKVKDGLLCFDPYLLRTKELSTKAQELEFINLEGKKIPLGIPEQALCLSVCQVPVIYRSGDIDAVEVYFKNGTTRRFENICLDATASQEVFSRNGNISKILVSLNKERFK
ncbi:MAG: hypothetical protein LAT67_06725 [Balneolales bacterium]|nr:hypothetical protein [Balneolales bacterium]